MKLPFIFLLSVFMAFWSVSMTAQTPPQPKTESSNDLEPCEKVYDDEGNLIPPPPGLCVPILPIDDYTPLLLLGGLVFGVYFLREKRLF